MLEKALAYLEEKHTCPHCDTELTLCHAPPMHVGDGLGWGSNFCLSVSMMNAPCSPRDGSTLKISMAMWAPIVTWRSPTAKKAII